MGLLKISFLSMCLVTQSCLTHCDPVDCIPADSSVHGDSPGKNIGVGCRALLQGTFPTQELNQGLLHCRFFPGELPRKPFISVISLVTQLCPTLCNPMDCQAPLSIGFLQTRIIQWVVMPSSRGSFQPRDQSQAFCIAGGFFTI